jgi:hypothetical protein
MAKRKHKKFRKIDSSEVQGEGSFVVIQSPGFDVLGDLLAVANIDANALENNDFSGLSSETVDGIFSLLEKVVVEWDWVDDEDNPLPQPKEDPDVIRRETTQAEQSFLVGELDFGGVNPKN